MEAAAAEACCNSKHTSQLQLRSQHLAHGIASSKALPAALRKKACQQHQTAAAAAAAAGAIPSALHLMSQFYPVQMRSKPFLAVTLANVVSVVFAGPLAAVIMTLDGRAGLRGWQWLFIIEGLPSIALGAVMMLVLPSGPLTAWMLTPRERQFLHNRVHEGNAEAAEAAKQRLQWKQMISLAMEALRMPQLWFFSIAAFLWVLGIFSLNAWMPIIIKNMLAGTALQSSSSSGGSSATNTLHATLLATIPYFCAAIAMWLNTWSASLLRERTLHVGLPCVFGGILLALFQPMYSASFAGGFSVLVIAIACAYSGQSNMFARVTESLDTRHAGVGIAIFNAIGAAAGGFSGPWVVGTLVNRIGSFVPSMVFMGVFLTCGGIMLSGFGIWELQQRRKLQRQQQQQCEGKLPKEQEEREGADSCVVVKDEDFAEEC
uniref:Major facilitator superfamily (MFS) profile domain-containing protein n=1 Tax=Tetradesmus obliquus TaxID=3088 RepID=A0A383VEN5_TETOB|eukprot:jgi/Sobl393_1/16210/SZX64018.1